MESKSAKIEFRLTPNEKERLVAFCAERHLTLSEAIRWACEKLINEK